MLRFQGGYDAGDKFGMEKVLARCSGADWSADRYQQDVVPSGCESIEGLPASDELQRVLVM